MAVVAEVVSQLTPNHLRTRKCTNLVMRVQLWIYMPTHGFAVSIPHDSVGFVALGDLIVTILLLYIYLASLSDSVRWKQVS